MSDVERSEDVNGTAPNENGVLANLPRARPQRSSARRLAARASGSSGNGAVRKPARARAAKASKPKAPKSSVAPVGESAASASAKASAAGAKASAAGAPSDAAAPKVGATSGKRAPGAATRGGSTRKRARSTPALEPAPRQGFESEGDSPTGSVQPPGGVELVASAAELVGELAKAGLSRSERLLKGVVSRLPLS